MPLTLMASYTSYDGPDDIPPTESFLTCFVRWTAHPTTAIFMLAGLITAALYWWLGLGVRAANILRRRHRAAGRRERINLAAEKAFCDAENPAETGGSGSVTSFQACWPMAASTPNSRHQNGQS